MIKLAVYIQDHHLIKCSTIYNLEKLNSKELYHMQLCLKYDKPTCQSYHEKNFDDYDFNWKLIYRIPRIATLETKIRIFQYKLLNNVLYLNKKLFQFGIISQFNVPSVSYMMKHRTIFFTNARMHKIYGTDFVYIFQKKLHYQF